MALFMEKQTDFDIEIRVTEDLQDRVIVAEDQRVWMLGMSLNRISRRKFIRVLTPLPEHGADALANWAIDIWENTETLINGEGATKEKISCKKRLPTLHILPENSAL